MTDLGLCRHRFTAKDRCDIPLRVTPFGPGHISRPRAAHYPLISKPAPALQGVTDADLAAEPNRGRDRHPGVDAPRRVRRSMARLTSG